MKKLIVLATLFTASAFAGNQDLHQDSALSYEQYIDYSTLGKSSPMQLDVINQIISEVGSLERVTKLAKTGMDKPSFVMGNLYIEGKTFEKDIERGLSILEKGAKNGPYSSFSYGMHLIDADSRLGRSENDKYVGAMHVYHAALDGLEEAEYISANLMIEGRYLAKDRDLAMTLLNSASSKGYQPAVKLLMSIRSTHDEYREDFDKIQRRANEGHLPSIVRLAQYYHHGWRVDQNKTKAKRLLNYARAQGSDQAKVLLDTLSFQ